MELSLHVRGRVGGGQVIVLRGELDFAAVDRFRACVKQVLHPPPGVLCIDAGLVTFADSSAMGALVWAHRQAGLVGARLVLENPSDPLIRTLRTAGLLRHFGLVL